MRVYGQLASFAQSAAGDSGPTCIIREHLNLLKRASGGAQKTLNSSLLIRTDLHEQPTAWLKEIRRRIDDSANAVQTVFPTGKGHSRLEPGYLRIKAVDLCLDDVGRVGDNAVEPGCWMQPGKEIALDEIDLSLQLVLAAIALGNGQGIEGEIDRNDPTAQFPGEHQGDRAASGTHIKHQLIVITGHGFQNLLDEKFGLRPRDEHRR